MKTKLLKQLVAIIFFSIIALPSFSQEYNEDGFPISGSIVGDKYGEDSITCVTQLSLYRENYRQWRSSNFKSEAIKYTIKPWRHTFLNCPLASQNIYIDGSKIIEYLYNNASDEETKSAYVDTLMMLYDQRIMAFGLEATSAEAYVLGRKAVELLTYKQNEFEEAYKMLNRSVKIAGDASESAVLFYYFLTTVRSVREAGADSLLVFDNYDIVSTIVDNNIKSLKFEIENNPTGAGRNERLIGGYESAMNNIDNLFEPFATCENLFMIYSNKYKNDSNDTIMLQKLISSFDKKGCTPPLYYEASEKLYSLSPSPNSALSLGKMYLSLDENSKAIKYLNDAVNGLLDNDSRADAYYYLAEAYKNSNNFSASKSSALKSLELRPNDGKPLILIGDLYVMSHNICGDNEVTTKAVYWVAVDKYQRARNIDESVAKIANSRIATYSAVFPNTEQLFFRNFDKGDSYTVECWINETTTVRSSD